LGRESTEKVHKLRIRDEGKGRDRMETGIMHGKGTKMGKGEKSRK